MISFEKLKAILTSDRQGTRFRSNLLAVARANVVAQATPIAAIPVLSRLYSPEDFGKIGLFTSIAAICVSFSTLRFEWLIPNTNSVDDAAELAAIAAIAACCNAVILTFLVLILPSTPLKFQLGGIGNLGNLLYLVPLACLGMSFQYILQSWYVKEASLKATGQAKIQQSLANVVLSVVGGLLKTGALGLILSSVISSWVGLQRLIKGAPHFISIAPKMRRRQLRNTFENHYSAALVSTCVSIANASFAAALPLLISSFYGLNAYGVYALVVRLAAAPANLISSALSQSFWAEAAILVKADKHLLRRKYLRVIKALAALSTIPLLVILSSYFFLDDLLGRDKWAGAAATLICASPQIIGGFIFSSTNHLIVYNRQDLQLYSDALGICLSSGTIIICSYLQASVNTALFLASLSILCGYVVRFFLHLQANKTFCEPRNLQNSIS